MAGPDLLTISLAIWQIMREEVVRWIPEEACGLLAGQEPGQVERVFPVANRLHSPTRFEMDPREQLQAFTDIETAKMGLVAIYHSHPLGPAEPSPTDLMEFAYPGVVYLIWSPMQASPSTAWNARAFAMDDQEVREIGIRVM